MNEIRNRKIYFELSKSDPEKPENCSVNVIKTDNVETASEVEVECSDIETRVGQLGLSPRLPELKLRLSVERQRPELSLAVIFLKTVRSE